MKVDLAALSGKKVSSCSVGQKPDLCKGCPAYNEPGPVWSDIGGWKSAEPWPKAEDGTYLQEGLPFQNLEEQVKKFPVRIRLINLAEAPGEDEVQQGKGLVGRAGRFYWKLAGRAGLQRNFTYSMNVAKCLTKNALAFQYCWRRYGSIEVNRLSWIRVLGLGQEALRALVPDEYRKITDVRGSRYGRYFFALHPSGLMRNLTHKEGGESESKAFKQDLTPTLPADVSAALEEEEVPPKQYRFSLGMDWTNPDFVSSDIETDWNLDPRKGPPTEIGFGYGPGRADSVRYSEAHRGAYQEVFDKKRVVWQFGLFDVPYLDHHGYRFGARGDERTVAVGTDNFEDTILGAHLLHGDLPAGLEFLNSIYVHYPPWKKGEKRQSRDYHATDLDVTWQTWYKMEQKLKEEGLWHLYQTETKPTYRVCMNLKKKGVRLDLELMRKMKLAFTMQARKCEQGLSKLAPGTNWNSSKDVIEALYGRWKLPVQYHRTRTRGIWGEGRPSASYGALEHLLNTEAGKHPGLRLLLYYRFFQHQISTYCEIPTDSEGFYHPDFSFTAATGRCRGDVLLTLPQTSGIRRLVVGDQPGWKVGYADWERVENWVGALDAHDLHFQQMLAKENLHQKVGLTLTGQVMARGSRDYEDIKRVSHGIPYGRSAKEISKNYEIPEAKAQAVIDWYHTEFKLWALWRQQTVEQAERDGFLENAFGFRRHFWAGNIRGAALAFFPQSEVAHMIKRVLVQAETRLPRPARIVMPLHDAVVFTYPPEMEAETLAAVKELMGQEWPEYNNHRFGVEINVGNNFDEASRH